MNFHVKPSFERLPSVEELCEIGREFEPQIAAIIVRDVEEVWAAVEEYSRARGEEAPDLVDDEHARSLVFVGLPLRFDALVPRGHVFGEYADGRRVRLWPLADPSPGSGSSP